MGKQWRRYSPPPGTLPLTPKLLTSSCHSWVPKEGRPSPRPRPVRISPGLAPLLRHAGRHGSGRREPGAHLLPALSCPLRHQDSYPIVLLGVLTFLPVPVMLIVVYGFWKKRHMGSEYSPPSQPPEGRALGLDTLSKAPACTPFPGGVSSPLSARRTAWHPGEGGGRVNRKGAA